MFYWKFFSGNSNMGVFGYCIRTEQNLETILPGLSFIIAEIKHFSVQK